MQEGQLRWQCRRGLLELELLLLKFLEEGYPCLPPHQKQDFVQLLQESDHSLQQWLFGQTQAATLEMQALVQCIRVFSVSPSSFPRKRESSVSKRAGINGDL